MLAKVDPRRRTQMQDNVLDSQLKTVLPFQKIHEHMDAYAKAEWANDEVVLSNGDLYQKHIQYQAVIDGREQTSQVWALRKETALDIVTLDGRLLPFLPRIGMASS